MDPDDVAREIVDLHRAFEGCFAGDPAGPERVDASLAPDFAFVGPDGSTVARSDLLAGLRGSAGTELAIDIRNVVIRWRRGGVVAATYEEWQESPRGTTARTSTVVLEADAAAPGGLMWLSVHETWITESG